MRRAASHLGWSGLALLGALAGAAACADEAVIVVDVTWTPELAARFGPEDQLRIYAGYPAGSGDFVCGDARTSFGPGTLWFVPAGESHRFEQFSEDFAAWVLFYGPDGGERG